jgi:hypothetical protein
VARGATLTRRDATLARRDARAARSVTDEGAGGPGGVDPLGALAVALRWEPRWPLSLEVHALVSVGGADAGSGESRATFNLAFLRALALWSPRREWRVRPALGLGAGVAIPWATAPSATGRVSSDRASVAWLGGAAQLQVRLSRLLGLRLDAHAGVLVPEVRVLFGDAVGARLGRPLLDASLALEATLR